MANNTIKVFPDLPLHASMSDDDDLQGEVLRVINYQFMTVLKDIVKTRECLVVTFPYYSQQRQRIIQAVDNIISTTPSLYSALSKLQVAIEDKTVLEGSFLLDDMRDDIINSQWCDANECVKTIKDDVLVPFDTNQIGEILEKMENAISRDIRNLFDQSPMEMLSIWEPILKSEFSSQIDSGHQFMRDYLFLKLIKAI